MRSLISTAALAAVTAALAACGGSDNDDGAETAANAPPVVATEPPVPQTTATGETSPAEPSLATLTEDTQDVVGDAAALAQRLADDPSAEVETELRDLSERAQALADQARSEADPAVDEAAQATDDAQAQAEAGADAVEEALSDPERRELRARLAEANERVVAAADRLDRVVDPGDAAAVARAELRDAQDELAAVTEEASGELPADVRRRADRVRDRLEAIIK